jgi:hypothetical protein
MTKLDDVGVASGAGVAVIMGDESGGGGTDGVSLTSGEPASGVDAPPPPPPFVLPTTWAPKSAAVTFGLVFAVLKCEYTLSPVGCAFAFPLGDAATCGKSVNGRAAVFTLACDALANGCGAGAATCLCDTGTTTRDGPGLTILPTGAAPFLAPRRGALD